MSMIDRIRQHAAIGFVVAVDVCLHAGLGVRSARAQHLISPASLPQFGPNHETEQPGGGIPISPVPTNFGIGPVMPGPSHPHSRTRTTFFPMVKDARLTFGAAYAADSVAIFHPGFGGYGYRSYGYGGYGYGGYGYGGYGYGNYGYSGVGGGRSLPPGREFGAGTYRAGGPITNAAVGMVMGGGNPANPITGIAGRNLGGAASEDAFDNAANGRPPAKRSVRSKRARSARRPTVRKPTPQPPSREGEERVAGAAPNQPGAANARPQQAANRTKESPNAVKAKETRRPRRRSMLGSSR